MNETVIEKKVNVRNPTTNNQVYVCLSCLVEDLYGEKNVHNTILEAQDMKNKRCEFMTAQDSLVWESAQLYKLRADLGKSQLSENDDFSETGLSVVQERHKGYAADFLRLLMPVIHRITSKMVYRWKGVSLHQQKLIHQKTGTLVYSFSKIEKFGGMGYL
jgi:hypothetical protein